jgi:mannosyltransferase
MTAYRQVLAAWPAPRGSRLPMRMDSFSETHGPRWLWATVSILLLAYALRVVGLTSESLWIDEGYSLALGSHSVSDIMRGAAADQHPPLYYLLLHLWLAAGQSVFHLRYLSVLIGTLGVAASARVGQQLLGRSGGVVAALLLACSPMHIWYSQEARMYILLALLTTVSMYMAWRVMRGHGGWIAYGLSTVLALYTHYFAGFIILLENALALGWGLKHCRGRFLRRWTATQVVLVALFAPWAPVALYQARFHQMTWASRPSVEAVRDLLVLMLLGGSRRGRGETLSAIGLGLVMAAVIWAMWRVGKRQWAGRYGFPLLWFVAPFGIIIAISRVYPLYQSKQFLMLLIPLLLLVAGAWVKLPRAARWALAGLLAFFVVGSLGDLYCSNTKHGWREAAGYIGGQYQEGDVLYLNPAAGMLTLRPYLDESLPYDGYPPGYDVVHGGWEGEQITAGLAAETMAALPDTARRVWLVEFGPEFWDPEGHIAAWLELHGQPVTDWSFQGVRMRLYRLAQDKGA